MTVECSLYFYTRICSFHPNCSIGNNQIKWTVKIVKKKKKKSLVQIKQNIIPYVAKMVMDFGHHNMISPQGLFWFPCGAGCSCVMIKIKKGQLLGKKKGFTLGSIPSSLSSKPCPKYVRIVFYRYVSVCVFFSSFLTLAGTYTLTLTLQRPRDGSLVVFS